MVYDLLAPTITLYKSDMSMLNYSLEIFIATSLLGIWDFKFTLFLFMPLHLVNTYFILNHLSEMSQA